MQGHSSTIDSVPENVEVDLGPLSQNNGMNQHNSLNNRPNPEVVLANLMESSSGPPAVDEISHGAQGIGGWNVAQPGSTSNSGDQVGCDEMKVEHIYPSSQSACSSAGPSTTRRHLEPSHILFPGFSDGDHVTGNSSGLRSANLDFTSQNVNLSIGYAGNNSGQRAEIGGSADPCFPDFGAPEIDGGIFAPSSSGRSGHLDERSGSSSSSMGTWGLSCKRKAFEGTSGQSQPGATSGCIPQNNNVPWSGGLSNNHPSASMDLSVSPSWNSPSSGYMQQLNPRAGVGIREVPFEPFPSSSITGNTEAPPRSFMRRGNLGSQQDSVAIDLSSDGSGRHSSSYSRNQSSRPSPSGGGSVGPLANTNTLQMHSNLLHAAVSSRNMHAFPWNGASTSSSGSFSNSFVAGEVAAALREEANFRSIHRNIPVNPMVAPTTESRNMIHDPTTWSLAPGDSSSPSNLPSNSRAGPSSSSSIWTSPPAWISRQHLTPNRRRLMELAPWSLFPSADSEPGGSSSHFPPLSSVPSSSSQETASSSGGSQGYRQHHIRSASFMDRQGDDVLGLPPSLRILEGRHRIISEIRQVLNAMRRGENLRAEDYLLFDPLLYHGFTEIQDRHRDMRLDVDNMSYEELLALEERIGDVSTGLTEETILKCIKRQCRQNSDAMYQMDPEPCCICQEEYADGDDLGILDCGHDFHINCIMQWLKHKNLCPICKTTGLNT